ncbi:hypothetical protein LTR66_012290 [Elasticomyces elasticus]|nr:hypothetical protein LTR66_012290 [Elasticomyces elasticus]KAK4990755.1 hypothetical protein LTR50_002291 [Elasticomyces elasticus]
MGAQATRERKDAYVVVAMRNIYEQCNNIADHRERTTHFETEVTKPGKVFGSIATGLNADFELAVSSFGSDPGADLENVFSSILQDFNLRFDNSQALDEDPEICAKIRRTMSAKLEDAWDFLDNTISPRVQECAKCL